MRRKANRILPASATGKSGRGRSVLLPRPDRDNMAGLMKKRWACLLPFLAILVTGCPHNQYEVELTPRAAVMDRQLVFYREDGKDTNGVPNYQIFPVDELALIQTQYPKGTLTHAAGSRKAVGHFSGAMPGDVGGSGSYAFTTNSLGQVGYYMERFRGDEDLGSRQEQRVRQVDKFVDLVIGWSRKEFGRERYYPALKAFLKDDFRRDMRNLGFYLWMVQASAADGARPQPEYGLRYAQYLIDKGYLQVSDLPSLAAIATREDWRPLTRVVQRLVAAKLRIGPGDPVPLSVKSLSDPRLLAKSWVSFLETTPLYRSKVRQWQLQRLSQQVTEANGEVVKYLTASTNKPPGTAAPAKPEPEEILQEIFIELFDFTNFNDTDDHLTVRLALPEPPIHTNGKWDPGAKKVTWEMDLGMRTNQVRVPAFCYASWSLADDEFQRKHFGQLLLKGEELLKYSTWRSSLTPSQAVQWEEILAGLTPGPELRAKLDAIASQGSKAVTPWNEVFSSGLKLLLDALPAAPVPKTPRAPNL